MVAAAGQADRRAGSCRTGGTRTGPRRRARPTPRSARTGPASPHAVQASSRERPLRFRTQTTRPSPRSAVTSRSEYSPARPGSSSRRSTTSTIGQPSRSIGPARAPPACPRPAPRAMGIGDTSTQGTPARRARSMTTSRACQVGARSSWYTSSCSSSTTTAARSRTGAQAAARVPITVAPAAPRASRGARSRRAAPPGAGGDRGGGPGWPTAPARGCCRGRPWRARAGRGRWRAAGAPPRGPRRRTPRRISSSGAWCTGWGRGRRAGGQRPAPPGRARPCGGSAPVDRPSATRPTGPARSARAAGPSPVTLANGRSVTPRRRPTLVGHDPAADAATVQLDPHHRADADLVPERLGDQVVERLVDGRRISSTRTTRSTAGSSAPGFAGSWIGPESTELETAGRSGPVRGSCEAGGNGRVRVADRSETERGPQVVDLVGASPR